MSSWVLCTNRVFFIILKRENSESYNYCSFSTNLQIDKEFLIFTSTGGMRKECLHTRLAQLFSIKKGEDYAKTISWITARTCFALLRSALMCLRGSRARRKAFCDFKNIDIDINSKKEPQCNI